MAALKTSKIRGCIVSIWKHTYRIVLPGKFGFCFWGTAYLEVTDRLVKKEVDQLLEIYEAGKKDKAAEIRKVINLNESK